MSLRSLFVAVALVAGCGAPQLKQPADVALSMQGIACQSCGETAIQLLRKEPGVASVAFDKKKVELQVHFDAARVLPGDLVQKLGKAGLPAKVGAGSGHYAPPATFDGAADVQWLTKDGSLVDVQAARVAGKVTVVDFGAAWCGPCRDVDKMMSELLRGSPDVALRKIDVQDWDSPVAQHYLKGVSGLPYVLVFGKDGRNVATIAGLDLARLKAAIATARTP